MVGKIIVDAKGNSLTIDGIKYSFPRNWALLRMDAKDLQLVFANGNYAEKYPKKTDFIDSGIPFLRANNIKDGYISDEDLIYISQEKHDELQRGHLKENDIIVAIRGNIGKSGMVPASLDGANLNAQLSVVRVKNSKIVLPKYLNYLFISHILQRQFEIYTTGTALKQLSEKNLHACILPIPPIQEQQRIVEHIDSLFDKLDEVLDRIYAIVEGSETRKSAILFKAYSGSLTDSWRADRGIDISSWETAKLKDVCVINPPKVDTKDLPDEMEVSFFPMPALSEVTGSITDPQSRPLKEVKKGFTNFKEGDVVFAKITPCMENGKSAIIPKLINDIGFGTTEFYVFRCSNKLKNDYLYHLIRSRKFRDDAKHVMTGAVGQQRVPKSYLEEYIIALPSIEEQEEIIRITGLMINNETKMIEKCDDAINEIELIKKAILAKAFRGELGTNDPSEESSIELIKQIIES